jgi:DNA-binding MarR family transcriptional regulator
MSATPQAAALLFLRDEQLRQGLELLFFATRDLGAEADQAAAAIGLSPGHRQILHLVGREPAITMSALVGILSMTKQTVSRLAQDLIARDFMRQVPGQVDRRQRLLTLTDQGQGIERDLWELQRLRIARAWRAAGADAVDGFRKVLLGLVEQPEDRRRFEPASGAGAR